MPMYPIHVAIVGVVTDGVADEESYMHQAQGLARLMNDQEVPYSDQKTRTFDTKVVMSAEEALEGHLKHEKYAVLIFMSITAGRRKEAEDIAKHYADHHHHSHLKVIIYSGRTLTDSPLIVSKSVDPATLMDLAKCF